ncbi:MAG TPA: peptidylprolyl isomerase [bacterium]
MSKAKPGDTVQVHYTGKLADGTVFDTSTKGEPLVCKIGEGQLIAGFEEAVVGMTKGESKTTIISADKAYGPYRDEMVIEVERNQLPSHLKLNVGQALQSVQQDGQVIRFLVTELSETLVTLDANHPLAGEELTFDIELLAII